ncbi:MAG TPA: type III PLP-dependent enzyme [Steroidobacteraceae bacterium]|nr:type III PLP-dependent enzyme [Steroidobacteraceae bacterium]
MFDPRPSSEAALELDPADDPFAHHAVKHLVARYGSPLLIIDAERVRAQYRRLAAALPGVDLHFALKPLPQAAVIRTLRNEGAFFDLATNGEVDLVRRLGIAAERCIHTHPIKRDGDIRTALAYGVRTFVVDNPDELRKFVKFRNRVSLLIRVSFRSAEAVVDLSRKFGCDPEGVASLIALAAELRIKVAGLSFHAGSQASAPAKHVQAIGVCRDLMRDARAAGFVLDVLDIGGGFPVDYRTSAMPIEEFCAPIRAALAPVDSTVRIIAEPGRFIAGPAAIVVASVMGRAQRDGRWWYYLDDGLYGSYSGQLYDHARYPLEALVPAGETHPSVLAGPTCDSIDVIDEHAELPMLDLGDLIVGRAMGAYTWATATEFNFFPKPTVLALDRGRLLPDLDRP